MTTSLHPPTHALERSDFIELLSAEFTCHKGYGVFAFLTYQDIEQAYHHFLSENMPATVFVRLFVRNYR